MCTFILWYLIWLIFNRGTLFVNTAFHLPCDISLIGILRYFLAALFIVITQTDLVYHQQFGLVYSRSLCLGDKLSSLVHEDIWDTFWKWPPEQILHVMVLSGHRVDINIFLIHKALGSCVFTVLLKELMWTVSAYLC